MNKFFAGLCAFIITMTTLKGVNWADDKDGFEALKNEFTLLYPKIAFIVPGGLAQQDTVNKFMENFNKATQKARQNVLKEPFVGKVTILHTLGLMSPEVAEQLIDAGADVNAKDEKGETVLHKACNEAVSFFNDDAEKAMVLIIERLIKKGADVNATDVHKTVPLYPVSSFGKNSIVELLLKNGASPNIPNENGWTPLFVVAGYNNIDTVKLLLKHGADVNLKDEDGETPVDIAKSGEMKTILENALKDQPTSPLQPLAQALASLANPKK